MRKVIVFIAMSLDGYIADKDGKVDWLEGQEHADEGDGDAYENFVKGIDTVIMGWTTYHQIVTELSPGQWVYDQLQSYVITHRDGVSTDKIIFTAENPCTLVQELKQKEGKNIWICGGANLIAQLRKGRLIDQYHLTIIPTLLGQGIRLFDAEAEKTDLRLISSKNSSGIVELVYQNR